MRHAFVVLIAVLGCLAARAEDWTVNGKDYHNVIVGQLEPDRVHISYDGGIGTVMLADLPPDLQKRFNYDPKAAIAATQRRQQYKLRPKRSLQSKQPIISERLML